jgi:hypothetical protein
MVDEEDQHEDARERQKERKRDREMGDEQVLFRAADDAQDEQAVEKRGGEDAHDNLAAAVAHETAQHPRPVLARSQ